jgi:hypothetical protein
MTPFTQFEVFGPFRVPLGHGTRGAILEKAQVEIFWKRQPDLSMRRGCYVFGTNNARGAMPWYVGKATRSFMQECFTSDKITKYLRALNMVRKGAPIMHLIALPVARGRANVRAIDELESHLIVLAQHRNPDFVNIQGRDRESWCVRGVIRSPKGKRSTEENSLRKLLGVSDIGKLARPGDRPDRESASLDIGARPAKSPSAPSLGTEPAWGKAP